MRAFVKFLLSLLLLDSRVHGKSFWSLSPANYSNLIQEAYPVGNGKLGCMAFGEAGTEKINLNVDSLWAGGPFESSTYTGDNFNSSRLPILEGIREWIFQNGTGNMTGILGENLDYGSYRVLGNISVSLDSSESATNYKRSLDLATGIHVTTYSLGGQKINNTLFCSEPDSTCIYHIASDSVLPTVSIALESLLDDASLKNATCGPDYARITGYTQIGHPIGIKYDAITRAASSGFTLSCNDSILLATPKANQTSLVIIIGAGTDYDQTKGNFASGFSFRGEDPEAYVESITSTAASEPYGNLLSRHLNDFTSLSGAFSLDLPDTNNTAGIETAIALAAYDYSQPGDPYIESLLFDYGRYLLISSSRQRSLPANLQGRWTEELEPAWSADYHANINLEMNYWLAEQTGIGQIQQGLWDYIQDTWVPRGSVTADFTYGGVGWVVHDEINVFGHTGMKNDAGWANYPIAPAWLMQHVWDHYDYSQDVSWLKEQGYPLIKGVAQFWLSQLQEDEWFRDGTLVVNPCNSAETGPTTFGCTHFQQLIHQLFEFTLVGARAAGEEDTKFVAEVGEKLAALDKGLHIGTWGQIKEWKLPESIVPDPVNFTYRHISQLVGWHPGYSISSFAGGYGNATIQEAVATTLWSRGNGTDPGSDDAGWAKVWRSACWARLNETDQAYLELRYAIDRNFVGNGFSMYSALSRPFQIDANFGLAGAVLSMLAVDLPTSHDADASTTSRTVVLGPAIPSTWAGGKVRGLRLRGGGAVDFAWDDDGTVTTAKLSIPRNLPLTIVNKLGQVILTHE
ncbi:Six-hairpin glycosidase-like protein [Xylariales sp. PMI_506]|nr:Six-hairpin glycosidase-like protein [Xylariales sp. PMI_506]